jgi:7-carboxy-7-deazaguanine synthase
MMINEIFYDLEGEGKYQGMATLFIRFTGCNLRCSWCDTKKAYNRGKEISLAEILRIVKKSPYKNINITGGEPLSSKKELFRLIKAVKKIRGDITVSVETNGSLPIAALKADNISMDLKLPSSGEHKKMYLPNLRALKPKDQLKLVIGSKKDMSYALEVLKKDPVKCVIFAQPVFGKIALSRIKNFVLKHDTGWKVSVQLHKLY